MIFNKKNSEINNTNIESINEVNEDKSIKKTKLKKTKSINKSESINKDKLIKKTKSIKKDEIKIKNNIENNKSKINSKSNSNSKINFNKILMDCVKDKNFNVSLNSGSIKELEKEYDNTFDDIISFRKKFTQNEINSINTIIYHDENNDGMIGCSIAYHYLKNNMNTHINLIPTKPGKFDPDRRKDLIENKNVIIIDLSLTSDILKKIINYSSSLIVIDDHTKTLENKIIFNGTKHAACAYTWKFFYPKDVVPKVVQFIDNSDAKLFLKYLPKGYSKFFSDGIGYRYCHNKSPKMMLKKKNGTLFDELWDILTETVPNFWFTIGFYYDEVTDNLKEQIAINAVQIDFQGYKVGVLNFDAPALTHPVGRQINSNFQKDGKYIDFALLWGFEHINNLYRIQLVDNHRQTKIDMSEIARKLGKIGGTKKGGGGHFHIGNFYWPHDKNHTIWDIFNKKYI